MTLPNSALADKQITNLSRMTAKKITATLRVRYADLPKMRAVIAELREVAASMPGLALGRKQEVYLREFATSAIVVVAEIHVAASLDDKQISQDFHLQLAEVLETHGVQFQPSLELRE